MFCYQCNTYWKVEKILCSNCAKQFYQGKVLLDWPIQHDIFAQFLWIPNEDANLHQVVIHYKNLTKHKPLSKYLINLEQWFYNIPNYFFDNKTEIIWVPVPSGSKRFVNHLVAEYMKTYFGGRVLDCLMKIGNLEQKQLPKSQRQNIAITLKPDFIKFDWSNALIIFIDDIITTGNTLKACWQAMSLNYVVSWHFAYRPKPKSPLLVEL